MNTKELILPEDWEVKEKHTTSLTHPPTRCRAQPGCAPRVAQRLFLCQSNGYWRMEVPSFGRFSCPARRWALAPAVRRRYRRRNQ